MSDRIMVMSEGRLTGILAGQEASEEEIMRLAAQRGQPIREEVDEYANHR